VSFLNLFKKKSSAKSAKISHPASINGSIALISPHQILGAASGAGNRLKPSTTPTSPKLKAKHGGFWVVAIDRTQWQQHKVFMASLIWGTHALPLCFEQIDHRGNSDLSCQQRLIKQVLRLFKSKKYPVLILGDCEFHSPKLADWLRSRGVTFCLRQRKSLYFKTTLASDYEMIGDQGLQPGQSRFYTQVWCNQEDDIGPLNLAVYWKRRYRGKGPKAPWYILTNLPTLKQALAFYRPVGALSRCLRI
jgi:hypothetical protein